MIPAMLATSLLVAARIAYAGDRRVGLVDTDPAFVEAVTRALAAWDVDVTHLTIGRPESDLTVASKWAHDVSATSSLGALVWLAPESGRQGPSLWLYDASTEQIVIRPLPASPPFDPPTAAAVALSVKTLLRSSSIAPEAERAPEAPKPAPETAAPAPPPAAPPSPSPAASRTWRIEASAGARVLTAGGSTAEVRGGIGATVWPSAWGGRLGLGAEVRAGPGISVQGPTFFGRFNETVLRAEARGSVPVAARFEVDPTLGAAFHVTSVDGAIVATNEHVSALRLDPGIFAGLLSDVLLGGRVSVGAYADATYLLRTQDYVVGGQSAFAPSPLEIDAGLRLSVGLN